MENIENLNNTFFNLYGELYKNTKFLTKKQLDYMSSKLLEQYKVEFEKIAVVKAISDKSELYEFNLNYKHKVPKRFLFFKNRIAKILSKAVQREVQEYFDSINNVNNS